MCRVWSNLVEKLDRGAPQLPSRTSAPGQSGVLLFCWRGVVVLCCFPAVPLLPVTFNTLQLRQQKKHGMKPQTQPQRFTDKKAPTSRRSVSQPLSLRKFVGGPRPAAPAISQHVNAFAESSLWFQMMFVHDTHSAICTCVDERRTSSSSMGSSKNLLMDTSSLMPCKKQVQVVASFCTPNCRASLFQFITALTLTARASGRCSDGIQPRHGAPCGGGS